MNPNTPQSSFELPAPQPTGEGEINDQKIEQAPSRPERASSPSGQPVASQPPSPQVPVQPQAATKPVTQPTQSTQNPIIADDNDLIEKEWVVKAKQIVSATRDDPHTQNREINRFKADYLKKRYNKDIKLEDA